MKFVLPGYFFLASLLALHFLLFSVKKKNDLKNPPKK